MISLPYQHYLIGQCTINCYDMTITVEDKSVTLPAKVFEFLKLLILHPAKTVTKEQAIEEVWKGNVEVGKRGTGNAIWQLRKSFTELGLLPEQYFKTITKVGYQLLIEPIPINQPASSVTPISHNEQATPIFKKPLFLAISLSIITVVAAYLHQVNSSVNNDGQLAKKLTLAPERITNFEGVEERAAISADGRLMAFQWRKDSEKGHLYIKDLHDSSAPLRQVSMSKDTEGVPSWSPDGQSLAYLRITAAGECFVHVRDLISNQDKQLDSGCISTGYLHSLEWSPDGDSLAYVKKVDDSSAVHLYGLKAQSIEAITRPKTGEHDLMMTWSANSQQLAVMRSQENMIAEIILVSVEDQTQQTLISGETLVIGLDWDHNTNQLYFTALREANFIIQQYDFSQKTLTDFHQDETISSITINEATNSLYYSRHISQEHITHRSLTDGRVLKQLTSSSRDLYGQYSPTTDSLIFLSNRSGSWELWFKQQNDNIMLTDNIGMVSIPAVSPVSSHYVAPIRTTGKDYNELYVGNTADLSLSKIDKVKGNIRYASFSLDGSKVIYSSLIDGLWGLYSYNFETENIELLLSDNVKYAITDEQQGIYYTLDNTAGIYYLASGTTQPVQINNSLRAKDWGSFFYQNEQLYFLERSDENDLIKSRDKQGNLQTAFALPSMSVRHERSLAAGKNDSLIASMQGINDADIYRIPLP
ncbi:winged helix-turn-helix domain-containing protein [Shewanella donghaensis]|uniref:winged helix-turn-helix domain-containing protein n=1 Tax=Shewanella donghaensis TaxID=238836 RepID=UPI0011843715|nr:winged helix-turn-helix domain-containing protein [Shewanella donghaensis]